VESSRRIASSRLRLLRAFVLVALAGGMLPETTRASSPRWFDTSTTFETGFYPEAFYPHAALSADLDGDGRVDYVASNFWFPKNVSVLFGDAHGFSEPAVVAIGDASTGVDVADFDGDGLLDIVAANTGSNYQGTTVSLVRGLGMRAFAPFQTFPAVTGPSALAAADFTGDGKPDLAVAGYGHLGQGTTIALLRNNGAGGFLAPVPIAVGAGPSDLEAADLNEDGRVDLVIARENQRVTILLNSGAGAFAAPVSYTTMDQAWAGDFYANAATADLDRDGDLDVLYSSTRTQIDPDFGAICVFENLGGGLLGNRRYIVLPRYLGGAVDMAIADVDANGWLDMISAHTGNGGWVAMRATGAFTFEPGIEYAGGNDPMQVDAADTDRDGDVDALVLNRYSLTLGVHLNEGSGTFIEPGGTDLEPLCGEMDAGDIDGDGDLDVVSSYAYAGGGGLSVVRNDGTGAFAPRENYAGPRGAMSPQFDDLDGDGDLDLVWAFDATSPPYDFAVRRNDGNGSFSPATIWPVGTCGTGDLATMDVDQDGDRDVLLTDWLGCTGGDSPWVWIRRNNGDATFAPPYQLTYETSPKEMAPADFDGDGKEDLATVHADGVKTVRALGGGAFGPPITYAVPDAPYVIAAGDWTGDGLPDIATGNLRDAWEGTISLFPNRGDGTFMAPTTWTASFSTDVTSIGLLQGADADLDGDLDILLMSYGAQDVVVFENGGNGSFARQGRYVIGAAPAEFRCLDFTGDGQPDLAAVVGLPPSNLPRRLVIAKGLPASSVAVEDVASPSQPDRGFARPNPFHQATEIVFSVASRGLVEVSIFDVSGREAAKLLGGVFGAGTHSVVWDGMRATGDPASAGVYFALIRTPRSRTSVRLLMTP